MNLSIPWFTPQMPLVSGVGLDQHQEPGMQFRSPAWVAATQILAPLLLPSQDAGAHEAGIGARTETQAL